MKRGRKTKAAKPGEVARLSLSLYLSADLKNNLDAAANSHGRSQSKQVASILERSFRDDEVLAELGAIRGLLVRFLLNGGGGR